MGEWVRPWEGMLRALALYTSEAESPLPEGSGVGTSAWSFLGNVLKRIANPIHGRINEVLPGSFSRFSKHLSLAFPWWPPAAGNRNMYLVISFAEAGCEEGMYLGDHVVEIPGTGLRPCCQQKYPLWMLC